MVDIKPSILLDDSKGNRYCFYYKDSSIFYREVTGTGDTKDTILISQAGTDFAAAIDSEDTIYVICNSRYKGVLLFTYTNYGWKFESVVNLHNSSNINIMDIIILNDSIHIFFSKKLPIANMYNVYHIHKNLNEQAPYVDYSWRKNSLSEIYSQNFENSYSILPTKGGAIYYASVWYDGTNYYTNYYCYDDSIKSWIHKSLNITYKNQVSIKLLYFNKKINLICFSGENNMSNIHHFAGRSSGSGDIDFKEINNTFIDTGGVIPLFYADEKNVQLAWIKDNIYHQYTLDDSSTKWRKSIDLPITSEMNLIAVKLAKYAGYPLLTKGFFMLDTNYNILRPIEHTNRHVSEDKTKDKLQAQTPETNDYLKQILNEMKDLSLNVRTLNKRIDNLESQTFVQKADKEENKEFQFEQKRNPSNESTELMPLKKSNFKEKFMKNEKVPDYESLLIRQDTINTYVGKPSAGSVPEEMSKEAGSNNQAQDSGKMAFTPPTQKINKGSDTANKNNSILKRLGEFFK